MEQFREHFKRFYDVMEPTFTELELEENVLADAECLIEQNKALQKQLEEAKEILREIHLNSRMAFHPGIRMRITKLLYKLESKQNKG